MGKLYDLNEKLQQAVRLHQQGHLAKAERLYRDVLDRNPSSADAQNFLGVLAMQKGKPEQAEFLLRSALRNNPVSPAILNNYGRVLRRLKRPADALETYDRALAIKPDDVKLLSNRGLALADLKRPAEALESYDRALAIQPDNAKALSNRGLALVGLKRLDEALESYDRALAIQPDHAETLSNHGFVLALLKRPAEALESYERALAIQPDNAEILSNRGIALSDLGQPQEALESYDRALAIQPDYAEALSNRGIALFDLRRPEEALESYRRAIAIQPDKATAHWNEALCRLTYGDFEQGWTKYEWRWQTESFEKALRGFSQPLWLGEQDIAGKTILLHAEQGFGDTIQFSRYAESVRARGANVVLEVPSALLGLLSRMVVGDDGETIPVIPRGSRLPDFDVHTPLLSLPLACGTRLDTIPCRIPYLSAPPGSAPIWRDRLGPRTSLRVGIAWSGNPGHRNDHTRSIALRTFAQMFAPGIQFVSLQKDVRPDDQGVLAGHPDVLEFAEHLRDFTDTAGLAQEMDLVVSVDTSVAHLAGALGKPVWLLVAFTPDYRWLLDRDDSPWYPGMRIYRQGTRRDWNEVVARVRADLIAFADGHPAAADA